MTHQALPRALETMRTYHNQVRALHLHLERLFISWQLLKCAHHEPNVSLTQQTHITKKIYHQLTSWGISTQVNPQTLILRSPHNLQSKNELDRPPSSEWIIRCWLDLQGELVMTRTRLNVDYVGCLRRTALVQLPVDSRLPPNAKHDQRQDWNDKAQQLDVDELLLCDSRGLVLESHNANFWLLECYDQVDAVSLRQRLVMNEPDALRGTLWVTPPLDGACLPGITRSLLVTIFKQAGGKLHFERIDLKKPKNYHDEVKSSSKVRDHYYYLSSTLKSLSPVSEINRQLMNRPLWDQALCAWVDRQLCRYTYSD